MEQICTDFFEERQAVSVAGLFGQYTHSLDQRNRLFVPSKMREALGSKFVLYVPNNGDRCVFGYSLADWDEAMNRFNDQEPSRQLALRQRYIYKHADSADVDNQGRFTFPASFMEQAGIEKEVFILGVGRRVEFWNPEEWKNMDARCESEAIDQGFELAF